MSVPANRQAAVIGIGATVQHIITSLAFDSVRARTASQQIVTGAAVETVQTRTAVQDIVAGGGRFADDGERTAHLKLGYL